MATSKWRRADHGDLPAPGDVITAVVYPVDTNASVIVYGKQRVEAALIGLHGVTVVGPCLENFPVADMPGRPKDIVGKRGIFWRYCDVQV